LQLVADCKDRDRKDKCKRKKNNKDKKEEFRKEVSAIPSRSVLLSLVILLRRSTPSLLSHFCEGSRFLRLLLHRGFFR